MRRLLIIFLLTLLPLQAAWASMCAYCPDNCISSSASGPTADDVANDEPGMDNDDECSRCQLGAAGIAPSHLSSRVFPDPGQLAAAHGSPVPDSGQTDRPERPNWPRAA